MTLDELNKLEASIRTEVQKEIDLADKLHSSGVSIATKYPSWTLRSHSIYSTDISDGDGIERTIEILKDFMDEVESLGHVIELVTHMNVDCEDSYISENRAYATYKVYSHPSNDVVETQVKYRLRSKITQLLKPSGIQHPRSIDCAVLNLFKEGIIDWPTLQRITYKDCEF